MKCGSAVRPLSNVNASLASPGEDGSLGLACEWFSLNLVILPPGVIGTIQNASMLWLLQQDPYMATNGQIFGSVAQTCWRCPSSVPVPVTIVMMTMTLIMAFLQAFSNTKGYFCLPY